MLYINNCVVYPNLQYFENKMGNCLSRWATKSFSIYFGGIAYAMRYGIQYVFAGGQTQNPLKLNIVRYLWIYLVAERTMLAGFYLFVARVHFCVGFKEIP